MKFLSCGVCRQTNRHTHTDMQDHFIDGMMNIIVTVTKATYTEKIFQTQVKLEARLVVFSCYIRRIICARSILLRSFDRRSRLTIYE